MAADTVARLQAALDETEAVLAVPFEQVDTGYQGVPDNARSNLSVTSLGIRGYKPGAGLIAEATVLEQVLALWSRLGLRPRVTEFAGITEVVGEIPNEGRIKMGVTDSAIALSAVTQLIETE